jgi:hypothetical protein
VIRAWLRKWLGVPSEEMFAIRAEKLESANRVLRQLGLLSELLTERAQLNRAPDSISLTRLTNVGNAIDNHEKRIALLEDGYRALNRRVFP